MIVFASPTFAPNYQSLCNKIADQLNRQDLVEAIPDFTVLATARISRDMSRVRHPGSIQRAQASIVDNYCVLPADFVAPYQLMDQASGVYVEYLPPDKTKDLIANNTTLAPSQLYYSILGGTLRLHPPPGVSAPTLLDLWYYATVPNIDAVTTTNWVLSKYPDLYLYGSLVHSAPYLKADERLDVWEGAYQKILADIEIEAERALRPQSKLVAPARAF